MSSYSPPDFWLERTRLRRLEMAKHWIAKDHPTSDNEHFEAATLNIFRAGLDWRMVEKKWPAIRRAFEEYGSLANYIRTIDEGGREPLVKSLVKRFKHLRPNLALHFLHSIGEDVPRPPERRKR